MYRSSADCLKKSPRGDGDTLLMIAKRIAIFEVIKELVVEYGVFVAVEHERVSFDGG